MLIDGETYISTEEAARRGDMTREHVTSLARREVVRAQRFGRHVWLINEQSFNAYISKPRQGWPRPRRKAIA